MTVLSIDVGIKNLAYCFMTTQSGITDFSIKKWGVIDLSTELNHSCSVVEKGVPCLKPAKFKKESLCFCLKHSKKQVYQVPTNDLKMAHINKQKIQNLYIMADKYKIGYEKPIKKVDLINLIQEYIHTTCFDPIDKVNASKMDLVTIGRNLQTRFDEVLENKFDTITTVIIENQISPIANRMKTIQGMIAQYFIMRNYNISIEFVNAANKLKDISGISTVQDSSQNSYKDRKKLGIQKCLEVISKNVNLLDWDDYFKSHAKKDDLADALLQGLWFINK